MLLWTLATIALSLLTAGVVAVGASHLSAWRSVRKLLRTEVKE